MIIAALSLASVSAPNRERPQKGRRKSEKGSDEISSIFARLPGHVQRELAPHAQLVIGFDWIVRMIFKIRSGKTLRIEMLERAVPCGGSYGWD
jgi:hypothetical protein